MNNIFENITYRTFLIYSLLFLLISCNDTEIVEIPVTEQVGIYVTKSNNGNFGAAGLINNVNKEYEGCNFSYSLDTENKMSLQIGNFEWYVNSSWALREALVINNLEKDFVLNDTVYLDNHLPEIDSWIYKIYEDGSQLGECFELFQSDKTPSWIIFTEYIEELDMIAGEINSTYMISELCPGNNTVPIIDTINVRNLWFRAEKVE